MKTVLGVVINWKRPQNVAKIANRLAAQCSRVVIVDNSPDEFDCDGFEGDPFVDDVWRIFNNGGPQVRWLPALTANEEFVFFVDDDLIPHENAVERLLAQHAQLSVRHPVGVIGSHARILDLPKYNYREAMPTAGGVVPVTMTCRLHFLKTSLLPHVLHMRFDMLKRFSDAHDVELINRHDDIVLCSGLAKIGASHFSVGPLSDDILDIADVGMCERRDHNAERRRMTKMAFDCGWRMTFRI